MIWQFLQIFYFYPPKYLLYEFGLFSTEIRIDVFATVAWNRSWKNHLNFRSQLKRRKSRYDSSWISDPKWLISDDRRREAKEIDWKLWHNMWSSQGPSHQCTTKTSSRSFPILNFHTWTFETGGSLLPYFTSFFWDSLWKSP